MGNPVTEGYKVTEDFFLDVDIWHIEQGIEEVGLYMDAVERGFQIGIELLAEKMREKMIELLGDFGLGDSSIPSSIFITSNEHGVYITVGTDYAIYVEYGTGVIGEENPHPTAEQDGWVYDEGGNGWRGWYYPTTEQDPNPNKRVFDGELYAWTRGQRSRPFMHLAWKWAKSQSTRIIRGAIRKEIRKVKGVKSR